MSTSTRVRGLSRRSAWMALAKWLAPPSGRSSRFTLVTTMYSRSSSLTALARFSPSIGSSGGGAPTLTWQKRHARVQTSPISMTVAVPPPQHSAMLGQRASSHTVASPVCFTMALTRSYPSPCGIRTLSHSGLRVEGVTCGRGKRAGVAMAGNGSREGVGLDGRRLRTTLAVGLHRCASDVDRVTQGGLGGLLHDFGKRGVRVHGRRELL